MHHSIFFGIAEIILVKEFRQGDSRALAKPFYGDDLRAFCPSLDKIVNRRGGHSAAQGDVAHIAVSLLADFFDSFDNCII